MTNKYNDKSWQKDLLNMKSHFPADAKLLMGGVKGGSRLKYFDLISAYYV